MFGCLFSFRGGSGRLHLFGNMFFWILALIGSSLLYVILIDRPIIGLSAIWSVTALSFFSLWAVTIRRIHDIGQSGWWAIFVMLILYAPLTGFAIYNQLQDGAFIAQLSRGESTMIDDTTLIAGSVVIVTTLVSFVVFIVLLTLPGKHVDNAYIMD
jgi:uncharacterized membrane protein YhaH (DUF805 family)